MLAHFIRRPSASPRVFAAAPDCTLPASYAPDDTRLPYAISACSSPLILWEDAMPLFWLGDDQWKAIAPLLPSRQTGPKRSDDRVVISGIVHVLISGIAWRDCPVEYGPSMTVFNRFNRWKHRGLWDRIVAALTDPQTSTLTAEQSTSLAIAMNTRAKVAQQHRPAPRLPDLSARAWDVAAGELRRIAHAHHGKPISAWVEAVVEWHMDSLFAHLENTPARTDGAETHLHELRASLIEAISSLRAYIDDPDRNRAAAKQQLTALRYDLMQAANPRRRSAS